MSLPSNEDGGSEASTAEVVDAAPAPIKDAGSVATEDASTPKPVPDAGCADRDGDRVCDADDNCPDDANPTQADADGDKVGDACAPVNCEGETVQTTEISTARLNRVTINGKTQTLARVVAGADVELSLEVTFSDCGVAFGAQQVYLGVESADADCRSAPCSEYASVPLIVPFTIIAPLVPGLHYVLAGIGRSVSCGAASGNEPPQLSTRVAALCVSPK